MLKVVFHFYIRTVVSLLYFTLYGPINCKIKKSKYLILEIKNMLNHRRGVFKSLYA